jgi:RNA polymerase sigma-70 factor, ECF subfamily
MPADGDLARRVAVAGGIDAEAENELCRRFGRRVRLYGLRHLRDPGAADDLVQRVLLLTIEKLRAGAVREHDRIGSFVLGAARMLVHESRRGRPDVPVSEAGDELPAVEPREPDPFASGRLARCLEALAERERTIVVLTYYGEQDSADIATTLGLAAGHVRVLRHRAIGRLRTCMGLEEAM